MAEKTGTEAAAQISPAKLKRLLSGQASAQEKIDGIRGDMGSAVATAVERDNLDKKMFGWIKQLKRMTPEKMAYHVPNFLYYLDASGISEIIEKVGKLNLDEKEPVDKGNVRTLRAPASVAAE